MERSVVRKHLARFLIAIGGVLVGIGLVGNGAILLADVPIGLALIAGGWINAD